MNPFAAIIRHFRRKKIIQLDVKVAGLTAKLKRTEELAKRVAVTRFDEDAIKVAQELWEAKRHLHLLSEEN